MAISRIFRNRFTSARRRLAPASTPGPLAGECGTGPGSTRANGLDRTAAVLDIWQFNGLVTVPWPNEVRPWQEAGQG